VSVFPALIAAAAVSIFIFVFMHHEPRLNIKTLSEEAIEARMKAFGKACEGLDASLNPEQRIENFDRFYDLVKATLLEVGSFSEGGLDGDADFSSSRYVDPGHVVTVVSSVPVTEVVLKKLLTECAAVGPDYAIQFDGIEGGAVLFTSGEFLREGR
jgi:hypothetical protein